ncbi:MAG TPA: ABC transporter permease [bacterium]|nr:ABC transporter permease [bacterium]
MITYVARRLLLAALTIGVISALSFVIIKLPPGDYVTSYIAEMEASGGTVSQGEAAAMRHELGLDRPLYVQYGKWMGRLLRGNFGVSLEYQRPVVDVIGDRLWTTVLLSVAALLFTWVLALPLGIYSAVRQYSVGDYVFTFIGFIGVAVPGFLLALVLLYVSFTLFNARVGGLFSPAYLNAPWSAARAWDLAKHLPLPALILAISGIAHTMRIMRANLLDELRKPYVTTARAKGLTAVRVLLKYPVRVALNPFISTVGYSLPYIVSGTIIVSLVLNLPTVGPLLVTALLAQDMFLAGVIILMLGVMTVVGTLLSDLVLIWADPRIRLSG